MKINLLSKKITEDIIRYRNKILIIGPINEKGIRPVYHHGQLVGHIDANERLILQTKLDSIRKNIKKEVP